MVSHAIFPYIQQSLYKALMAVTLGDLTDCSSDRRCWVGAKLDDGCGGVAPPNFLKSRFGRAIKHVAGQGSRDFCTCVQCTVLIELNWKNLIQVDILNTLKWLFPTIQRLQIFKIFSLGANHGGVEYALHKFNKILPIFFFQNVHYFGNILECNEDFLFKSILVYTLPRVSAEIWGGSIGNFKVSLGGLRKLSDNPNRGHERIWAFFKTSSSPPPPHLRHNKWTFPK